MSAGHSLAVRLYGAPLGVVRQDARGRVSFTYRPESSGRVPLSMSMPRGTSDYAPSRIVPFLEGLLPDSQAVREAWAREFDVSPRNAFALLSSIGRDCAGAVEFFHEEQIESEGSAQLLTDEDVGRRLRHLAAHPAGWLAPGERWSLAGAQSKFTLSRSTDGRWFDGESCLVVTRFDRRRARDGSIVRVHQEDMCQALAVYPRKEYEAGGGPSAARIAQLLRDNATGGERDVWEFAQALVFNYLIGAPDAHAKNYSIMHAPGLTQITPLYDVASALPYDVVGDSEIDQSAMSIGGRRKFGTVHGRHWDRLARQLKFSSERLRDEIVRQADAVPAAVAQALGAYDEPDLAGRWIPRLEHLCNATVTQLRD